MRRIAEFYKISKNDLNKDFYDDILLPKRSTSGSCGYDFYIPYDLLIKAHESVLINSFVRCKIRSNYCLLLFPRSSLGIKYKLTLNNTCGVIDSDYFYADNEGHIMISLTNNSDTDLYLKKNDRFVQGIFIKYYMCKNDHIKNKRKGGFGSTGN